MSHSYHYQPLVGDEIRLLQLLSNSSNGSLQCRIVHRRLSDLPLYDALSYAWGSPDFTHTIVVKDAEDRERSDAKKKPSFLRRLVKKSKSVPTALHLRVTPTLVSALFRIRRQYSESDEAVFVWADAICINQQDLAERSAQVQLMSKIYNLAKKTWVDLGAEADHSHLVPEIVERLLSAEDYIQELSKSMGLEVKDLPQTGSLSWVALNAIVRRPWFGRVWIMQEVTLSHNVVVLCGNWSMPFDNLAAALEMKIWQRMETDKSNRRRTEIGLSQLSTLQDLRSRHSEHGGLNLVGLMVASRARWATQSVDYIYGVLGLSELAGVPELRPDYTEPTLKTLKRYAKFLVMNGMAFQMLQYVCQSLWVRDQPSWIPSWLSHTDSECVWPKSIGSAFRAAGDTVPEMTLCDVPEMDAFWLVVKGVAIDVIESVGDNQSWRAAKLYGADMKNLPHEHVLALTIEPYILMEPYDMPPKSYPSMKEVNEAFVVTMMSGASADTGASDYRGYSYAYCFHHLVQQLPRPHNPDDPHDAMYHDMAIINFVAKLQSELTWSVLAMTGQNHLLGRVPIGTQPGDLVALFSGCKVPYVLRRRPQGETGYLVVGPCYMHGIMDGSQANAISEPALMEFVLN